MSLIDDYQLLEIPKPNASEQEAKTAFRRLARRYIQIKNPDTDTQTFPVSSSCYENVINCDTPRCASKRWENPLVSQKKIHQKY